MSSLSVALSLGGQTEADPHQELMQLCKRTDAVVNECNKAKEKLEQMRRRTSGFVHAEDLDASRDGQAAIIAGMEEELADVMQQIRESFIQRKNYEVVRPCEPARTCTRDIDFIYQLVPAPSPSLPL
eukprot:scaffold237477_cov31-Tisochrysis_lutea.AAC.1